MAQFGLIPSDRSVACIRVSGEYDLADRRTARRALENALDSDTSAVLVDLSGCWFIDSAALRVLACAREDAVERGKGFAIVDSHLQVERFLRIMGYPQDFGIVRTHPEALERLGARRRRFAGQHARTPVPAASAV